MDSDISMEVVEDIAVEGEVMVEDAGKTAEEDIDDEEVRPAEEEEYEPPTQRRRRNAFEALDGVPEVPVLDPKDVNIGAELERLYKSKVFKAKKDEADRNPNENQKTVPKRALYDCDCMYFFGLNPRYENDQHGGKQANIEAMIVAAIAFEAEQWNKMFTKLDDKDLRKICSDVNKQAQEWLKKKTIDICQVSPKTVFKKLKNLRCFSTKYRY